MTEKRFLEAPFVCILRMGSASLKIDVLDIENWKLDNPQNHYGSENTIFTFLNGGKSRFLSCY